MLKIGLTGGIASGKSAAATRLVELGADVVDADLLSRELVMPGQPALAAIVTHFGRSVLTAEGLLDRAGLRNRIFSDPTQRRALEAILHPRIRTAMLDAAARSQAPYVVLMIPLLVETGQQALVDRVLTIDTPTELQRRRLRTRDHLADAQIDQALAAQTTRAQRLLATDDVICNDRDLAALHAAVDVLHRKYLVLARDAAANT